MQIFTTHDEIRIEGNVSVALGNFDGIHVGHMRILEDALRYAKENGVSSACYTFSNHPVNYFLEKAGRTEDCVKLILTEEDKLLEMERLGFDYVINVPFDEETMSMDAEVFIHDILAERLHAVNICCGFNYTFGARAAGDTELLRSEGRKLGMNVNVHSAVNACGDVVSSTRIRKLISEGDVEQAGELLGRAYYISGAVSHGKRIGTRIGFPTMNIDAPETMALPPNGVYFTYSVIDGARHSSITNVGVRPTVDGACKTIETNVLDFSEDVYGKDVRIEFLKFERPEMKFETVEDLRRMIETNVRSAIDYHKARLL